RIFRRLLSFGDFVDGAHFHQKRDHVDEPRKPLHRRGRRIAHLRFFTARSMLTPDRFECSAVFRAFYKKGRGSHFAPRNSVGVTPATRRKTWPKVLGLV